ncbi:MAG: TlpA disulfide reductase family protein [Phycisphaerales bacterium]|jgi:peroxiredoxin
MFRQKKKGAFWFRFSTLTILLVAIVAWTGCKERPSGNSGTESMSLESVHSEPATKPTSESAKMDTKSAVESKVKLSDVIKAARTWRPAFKSWQGEGAPDFTLTDIAGKEHKLSDYKGKDILLVFWATWCGPCRVEVPHLIELRKAIDPDKLAMLAISNEQAGLVKSFVEQAKINYTVLLDRGNLPGPYNGVNAIPSSFFIDSKGKIKLATSGLISLEEIKAILKAK